MFKSNSASNLHYFDSIKWKKRLNKISHKLQHRNYHSHHWNAASLSATALAAATEKFARHHERDQTDSIAIHSEDLTASQFANLTGIKTKRNSSHSIYSSDYTDSDSEEDEDDDCYSTTTTTSTPQSPQSMRIWDSHFWHDSRRDIPLIATPLSTTTSLNEAQFTAAASLPMTRNQSEPGGLRVPSSIQKGRFKIVWGQDDDDTADSQNLQSKPAPCVEWKRKRSSSNGSASTSY